VRLYIPYVPVEIAPPSAEAQQPGAHVYLSTGCYHGDHDYCQAMTGLAGAKRPAECKHCGAKCVCGCHQAEAQQQPEGETRWGVCSGCGAAAGPDCDCPPDAGEDHSCAESGCSGEPGPLEQPPAAGTDEEPIP
jgi:hypothetical protein